MRVVIRTSRTDSVPRAGRSVTGHFSTVAVVHGAMATARTPESGWLPSRHRSASGSASVTMTARSVSGIRACHCRSSCERAFPLDIAATVAARWRDSVRTVHPSVPVTGSAQGVRCPSHGLRPVTVLPGCECECERRVRALCVQTRGPFAFAFTMTARRWRGRRPASGRGAPGPHPARLGVLL
jgi:hypothetical protein